MLHESAHVAGQDFRCRKEREERFKKMVCAWLVNALHLNVLQYSTEFQGDENNVYSMYVHCRQIIEDVIYKIYNEVVKGKPKDENKGPYLSFVKDTITTVCTKFLINPKIVVSRSDECFSYLKDLPEAIPRDKLLREQEKYRVKVGNRTEELLKWLELNAPSGPPSSPLSVVIDGIESLFRETYADIAMIWMLKLSKKEYYASLIIDSFKTVPSIEDCFRIPDKRVESYTSWIHWIRILAVSDTFDDNEEKFWKEPRVVGCDEKLLKCFKKNFKKCDSAKKEPEYACFYMPLKKYLTICLDKLRRIDNTELSGIYNNMARRDPENKGNAAGEELNRILAEYAKKCLKREDLCYLSE